MRGEKSLQWKSMPFYKKPMRTKQFPQRAVRPVSVFVGHIPALYRKAEETGSLSASVIVDEEDLVRCFGERVEIRREINTDLNVLVCRAFFRPSLMENDTKAIEDLIQNYENRRNAHPRPIQPPLRARNA